MLKRKSTHSIENEKKKTKKICFEFELDHVKL